MSDGASRLDHEPPRPPPPSRPPHWSLRVWYPAASRRLGFGLRVLHVAGWRRGGCGNWIAGDPGHEHGDAWSRDGRADLGICTATGHGFGELLRDRQWRHPSRRNMWHLGITYSGNDLYRHRTLGW